MVNTPPNDQRNFVHGRIKRAIGGVLTRGPLGALDFFQGEGRAPSGGQPIATTLPVRPPLSRGNCSPGRARVRGKGPCVLTSSFAARQEPAPGIIPAIQRFLPGGATGMQPADEATMGRHGAALAPSTETRVTRRCLPGMVLGNDGLCYNRRDIRNSDREWPRGRRPLGTPGELAALAKAAAFGRRMKSTVKRMEKIGVLKKPSRGRPRASRPKLIGPGGTSIINVE